MLLDANVLLYSINEACQQHARCADWLTAALNGNRRLGLPWQTIGAFLRIATHPRVFPMPLHVEQAWRAVEQWLAAPVTWIPPTTERTARILGDLVTSGDVRGNVITDAQLAALAIEHGVSVVSTDTDFARFREVRWINPLAK